MEAIVSQIGFETDYDTIARDINEPFKEEEMNQGKVDVFSVPDNVAEDYYKFAELQSALSTEMTKVGMIENTLKQLRRSSSEDFNLIKLSI
jgi:hypothetical protein